MPRLTMKPTSKHLLRIATKTPILQPFLTKGSQDKNENLEDVRGIQLSDAMKNMDVGELRPRQVNDEEDDQVQVLSNSNA